MNIFVVSHSNLKADRQALINELSRIQFEPSRVTPVVVVDQYYNLSELPGEAQPEVYVNFVLANFLSPTVGSVEPNRIAHCIGTADADWILIDFDQYDASIYLDFIIKLGRYNYVSPRLRKCNLVITLPAVHLCNVARAFNASFNNLPLSEEQGASLYQVKRMYLRAYAERLFASLPLPAVILRFVKLFIFGLYRILRRMV
ncbi:hypothetical protein KDX38_13940 [Pseudomonas sp. CDFA 602]|uniref:hypothetical protein n=1 Tax=Pseudomonas californiensis TaxID=2829823 RepID=UPI001E50B7B0|nr:hypothetical protein [Pseudomonas californiensis]MCD5994701.1 hypothetical protein [Pseudomonas californiensis]MCD6000314.1 hypothetical protein [Pseudomonas californiensis]